MDKRKKYFCVVAMVLILLSGYGKISDSAFRMWVTRMIAGEGMLRLVAAQYGQKAAEPVAETASDRSEKRIVHVWLLPLMMDRMQHIHLCFWMACGSVGSMPHFFLWEKISGEMRRS